MSYPYDSDPWGDNPTGSSNQDQPASNYATATGTTAAGYSNPVNQYYYDETGVDPSQQQQQQQYSWNDDPYSQQQQQQQPMGYDQQYQQAGYGADPALANTPNPNNDGTGANNNNNNQQQQPSAFRRFIGAHVPICGSVMDTCSSINLPFIDALVQRVNRDLLVSKMFYFFFYSAFGSLFPLMGVYFKQLGMNPAQVGILTGVRPFIEIFSAPFWNSLAERFNKRKALLIFSIVSWIVFTYSLCHIRPPASACIAFNDTDYELYIPYSGNALANPDVSQFTEEQQQRGFELANNITTPGGSGGEALAAGLPKNAVEAKESVLVSEESESTQRRRRRKRSPLPTARRDSQSRDEDDEGGDERGEDRDRDRDRYRDEPESERERGTSENNEEPEEGEEGGERSSAPDDEDSAGKATGRKGSSEASDESSAEESSPGEEMEEESGDESSAASPAKSGSSTGKQAASTGSQAKTSAKNIELKAKERERDEEEEAEAATSTQKPAAKRKFKDRHKTPPTHIVGMSPITVEYAAGYNKTKHSQFVTPMFSTVVYKLDDIKSVFFLLLLLISLGEFFSAPAITLADSATLRYLGDQVDLYCRQRMFGSLSWAVTLLLVGMALDNATSIADHPCGPHLRERSYTVCYMIFSLLMGCALMTATQFRFDDDRLGVEEEERLKKQKKDLYQQTLVNNDGSTDLTTGSGAIQPQTTTTIINNPTMNAFADDPYADDLYASTQPRSIFNTAPPVNEPPPGALGASDSSGGKEKFEFLDKWKSAVFAQRTRELPQWVNVFRQFSGNPFHLTYLFITWFLGCGVGLVFTFLFWHLQDVGGTPTLFGICSVINHISEIFAYFFSFSFIKRFGHTRVLSVGLGCNAIRFVYIAFLTNPYYALPFELVQGITHAACFAACCSYMSHKSSPELKNSTQGVMQGLHHGIGRACGTLLGGFLINAIGSRASFALYGILSAFVLAGFLHVRKKTTAEELEIKVDDSDALGGYGAPQGVPGAKPTKLS